MDISNYSALSVVNPGFHVGAGGEGTAQLGHHPLMQALFDKTCQNERIGPSWGGHILGASLDLPRYTCKSSILDGLVIIIVFESHL